MSSVGKILVVVNLVLSLLVLGSLGALLQASKATADDNAALQQQLDQAQSDFESQLSEKDAEIRALNGDKTQLENDKTDLEVRAEKAEQDLNSARSDFQDLNTSLTKLSASFDQQAEALTAKDQRIADLQDSNDDLRRQTGDAQDGERAAVSARRDAEDRVAALERQIAQKDDELADAMARAHEAELLVDLAKEAGFNPASMLGMPSIEGMVAQVDNDYGFVIIDKGSNDNVEMGFTFDIYRPGANGGYLGQVKVDDVHADYCTATIVTLAPDRAIQRSDLATTRL